MIIANPIYDSVFRVLMADLVIAKGVLSVLIGRRVAELRMDQQEYVHKHPESGALLGLRLDFHAVIETATGDRFNVIIELQKASAGSNPVRFRSYLASQYQTLSDVKGASPISLPIISVYLLGYELNADLPMVTHVSRHYQNAVTGEFLGAKLQRIEEFIELLTHDAYFVQIPKISGQRGTELERVLSVFDQRRRLVDDNHRLEIDENSGNNDPLISKMYRCLNEVQEDPKIQLIMTLEDLYLAEQQDMLATERRRMQAKFEEETRELREKAAKAEARLQEEARKREQEARKREEEARKREEEAEIDKAEIERLKKLLEEKERDTK